MAFIIKKEKQVFKYTEKKIQEALAWDLGEFRSDDVFIPNVNLGTVSPYFNKDSSAWEEITQGYEADLIMIDDKDRVSEFEIKINIADFRRDKKKKVFHDFKFLYRLYYAMPKSVYEKNKEEVDMFCSEKGAGLYVVNEWTVTKVKNAEKKFKFNTPIEVINHLLRLGCIRWIKCWSD